MPSTRLLRKLASFGTQQWLLLLESAFALVIASLMVRLLPFRSIAAAASSNRQVDTSETGDYRRVRAISWAIEAMASRVPWRTVCIQKGVAAQLMLRRRKLPATLHYGLSNRSRTRLEAHIWVTSGPNVVVGGKAAEEFACVAVFPPASKGAKKQERLRL